MEGRQYESVKTLIRQIHGPTRNVSRPHEEQLSPERRKSLERSHYSLPILAVETPQRKRTVLDHAFKIPTFTITGPQSPESPENSIHRKFSFGNFRRHSHSSVRYMYTSLIHVVLF